MRTEQVLRQLVTPAFILIYLVLSLYVMAIFLQGNMFGGDGRAMLSEQNGRPIVYRLLVRAISKPMIALTPDWARENATENLLRLRDTPFMQRLIHHRLNHPGYGPAALSPQNIYNTAVVMLVVYGFLLAFIAMLYETARVLMPDSRAYAFLAPVLALMALPAYHFGFAHIYDYSMLFFMTAGVYVLARSKWRLFLVVLVFATLNRETSWLLILLFAVYAWGRMPGRTYGVLLAAQAAIYVLAKGMITYVFFARNPGTGLVYTYEGHLWHWLTGYSPYWYLSLLVFVMLLVWHWQEKPPILRAGLLILPGTVAGYVAVGLLPEQRQLLEALPVCVLLLTHTLVRSSGWDQLPLFHLKASTPAPAPP